MAQLGKGMCAPQAVSAACSLAGVAGASAAATAALLQGTFACCCWLPSPHCQLSSVVSKTHHTPCHGHCQHASDVAALPQVLKGLRRGVLSGDTPALMMWRLCTSSLQQAMHVRPSLGGMLASILMHKIPHMRQQVGDALFVMHAPLIWPAPDILASALVGVTCKTLVSL